MNRSIKWYDYITHNIYWTGLTSLSQTTTPLILPLMIQRFVGTENQATYYGTLRLWTLMIAILVQAIMGMVSDRSRLAWGRRRPFILIGNIGTITALILIGLAANFDGIEGYWILFSIVIFLMVATNTAHSATQGIIPDLVPESYRGRFSGFKALLEVPLPIIIVSLTIGKLVSQGNIWGGLYVLIAILFITMIITLFIPEKRIKTSLTPINWQPITRILLMTTVFTIAILLMREFVNLFITNFTSNQRDVNVILIGAIGLLAMLIAVVFGVSLSIQTGLGNETKSISSFKWWVINRLCFLIGSTNLGSFFIFYLQGRLGYEKEQAAAPATTLLMYVGIFVLLSALPSGYLVDRYGPKVLVAISGLLAAIGTGIVLLAPNLIYIYIGGCVIGTAIGLFYTSNWALGTSIIPNLEAGGYLGISNLAGAGAGAVGAYIGGPIADYITRINQVTVGIGYIVLFSIYGCLFLFSILALKFVKYAK